MNIFLCRLSVILLLVSIILVAGCAAENKISPAPTSSTMPVPVQATTSATHTSVPSATSTPPEATRNHIVLPTKPQIPYCEQLAQNYQAEESFTTYCDEKFLFAFDYPVDWEVQLIAASPDNMRSSPLLVRKAQRFHAEDMSNFIRTDTYHLYDSMSLAERTKRYFTYKDRVFADKDYPSLIIAGKRAYVTINHWIDGGYPNAVYLFFEHSTYYTVMELTAPDSEALDVNWKIARSVQVSGTTPNDNIIPDDLIEDSYRIW